MRLIFRLLWYSIVFASLLVILPGNILLDIEPKELDLPPLPLTLTGVLKPNERLSKTTKLFENKLFGPESVAALNGKLVTGAADGFLYLIDGNNLKPLIKLVEKSCADSSLNLTKCGRPLGLNFNSKGILYVTEPHVGVFSVRNIFKANPRVDLVFNIDETSVLGKTSKFLDDLTIDEGSGLNGGDVLYISDMSTNFDMSQIPYLMLGPNNGRILRYDINAKKVESIAENLLLPNGVQLTDNRNAVLVNEFLMRRVLKLYIKGPKKDQLEVLVENLPGGPDNIRRSASKKETYWLGLFSAKNGSKESRYEFYLKRPVLTKIICRSLHLFGTIIEFIGNTFGNSVVKEFGYHMKNGEQLMPIIFDGETNEMAIIVEIDINGQIVDSLQAMDPTLSHISEVREVRVNERETTLYLGSFINQYLGKLTINR